MGFPQVPTAALKLLRLLDSRSANPHFQSNLLLRVFAERGCPPLRKLRDQVLDLCPRDLGRRTMTLLARLPRVLGFGRLAVREARQPAPIGRQCPIGGSARVDDCWPTCPLLWLRLTPIAEV